MPSDDWMRAVARELNVSDTAFVVAEPTAQADFRLRWYTPVTEVDLCGHATLAAAHCLLGENATMPVRFCTRSGVLSVTRERDGSLAMDFPANPPAEIPIPIGLSEALGAAVTWAGRGANDQILAAVDDEEKVRTITPDLSALSRVDAQAVVVTAQATSRQQHDFVSRVFAPRAGIPEDPVTGSAHTVLGPYWGNQLDRRTLIGLQASSRPGYVQVRIEGDRVVIIGRAVSIFTGKMSASAGPV